MLDHMQWPSVCFSTSLSLQLPKYQLLRADRCFPREEQREPLLPVTSLQKAVLGCANFPWTLATKGQWGHIEEMRDCTSDGNRSAMMW